MTTETQIEQFQYLIHYAPEKKREYLKQIQPQDRLTESKKNVINNHSS